jgi:hypothetical protein
MAGLYARTRIVVFAKLVAGIDAKKVERLEKNINTIIRIVTVIAGVLVVAK